MCLWKSVHVLFVAGQWKQCCDGLMKIDTLNSRKAITVKQGSLYHEIGNVTEDALPDLISSFPPFTCTAHHFAKTWYLCDSGPLHFISVLRFSNYKQTWISCKSCVIRAMWCFVFFSWFWKKSPSASGFFRELWNSVLLQSSRNVAWPPKSPPTFHHRGHEKRTT